MCTSHHPALAPASPSSWALLAVAISLLGACTAHEAVVRSDGGCPSSSLPPPAACVHGNAALRIGGLVDMPNNDLAREALTAASLDANHALLMALASHALRPDLFTSDDAIARQLVTPYAGQLVKYVVSCALDPCDAVQLPEDPPPGASAAAIDGAFRGELGLCGERFEHAGGHGDALWRDAPASQACLERVSACVLARTNAVGSKVVFSLRGEGTTLQPRVPTRTELREAHGTPIASFQGCDAACLSGDPLKRNCDWEPRFVGQCVSKATVRLALSDPKAEARIRVCAGLHGCDSYAPGAGPTTVPGTSLPRYGGVVIADAAASTIELECPFNGPMLADGTQTGYYAVMVGSLGAEPLPAGIDVERVDADGAHLPPGQADAYPASELAVFSYREGAFYGTLFDQQHATPTPNHLEAVLSEDQYACYSSAWSDGAAASSHRWCAGASSGTPVPGCFVNEPGPCDDFHNTPGLCRSQMPEPRVASDCDGLNLIRNDVTTWSHPYTTFLNHPCDLFDDDVACIEALDPMQFPWITVRPNPPMPQL